MKVQLHLSNYVIKVDLKNGTGVDKSSFATNSDLGRLKSEISKLDLGKLETTPLDLSQLADLPPYRAEQIICFAKQTN